MFVAVTFFFFKQKTAYEMRISDWSSDVCSSDLCNCGPDERQRPRRRRRTRWPAVGYGYADAEGLDAGRQKLHSGQGQLHQLRAEIGRASCRERVCQYV